MAAITLKAFLHPRYWYAWPVLCLALVMSWLPRRALWLLGGSVGSFLSLFPVRSRRFAERNLELCFPELPPGERRGLVRRHFQLSAFAMLSLCVVWFAPKWRIKRFVAMRDYRRVEDAFKSGRNVILLAPHFIGLDIGAMRASFEKNFVSMYRRARDPLLEYLFQRRCRYGAVVVERFASLKPVIRLIREGRPFYYLPDQDMGEKTGVFVPFFGIPAATVTALSRIAQATNAAVIPCITCIGPGGAFEVRFLPAFENFPTDDPVADARRMNAQIEQWVREMPDQYMWSYRRFKTRPNNEPQLYTDK